MEQETMHANVTDMQEYLKKKEAKPKGLADAESIDAFAAYRHLSGVTTTPEQDAYDKEMAARYLAARDEAAFVLNSMDAYALFAMGGDEAESFAQYVSENRADGADVVPFQSVR